jgi:hypothetical protein
MEPPSKQVTKWRSLSAALEADCWSTRETSPYSFLLLLRTRLGSYDGYSHCRKLVKCYKDLEELTTLCSIVLQSFSSHRGPALEHLRALTYTYTHSISFSLPPCRFRCLRNRFAMARWESFYLAFKFVWNKGKMVLLPVGVGRSR